MRTKVFVCLLLLTVLTTIGWNVYAQKQGAARQQWEYKIVAESEKIPLNNLGAEGWELVAVEMSGTEEVYFFKRAK